MFDLNETDILTKVSKYNLISSGRMIHIDIHEAVFGTLAGKFVAVPNLINIIAKQEYQGVGDTEKEALQDCLEKIKGVALEDLFPKKEPVHKTDNAS
jgi:hypothetical protein